MHMFLEQKYRLFGLMTSYGAHSEKMRERERERERMREIEHGLEQISIRDGFERTTEKLIKSAPQYRRLPIP